jgi:uncharacterized membrane protein YjjP (DUF1212 family)
VQATDEPLRLIDMTTQAEGSLAEALEALLRFGGQLLSAGHMAYRVRQFMEELARKMHVDSFALQLALSGLVASGRRGTESATLVREVGMPGVNTARIQALQELVGAVPEGLSSSDLHRRLDEIERVPVRYSNGFTAAAVGMACGAFAFINGGGVVEILTAMAGSCAGQSLRATLLRRRFNQYAAFAVCGLVAAAVYVALTALLARAGFGADARHAAGLISSVLFLVPGFPLVAGLLDLFQHEIPVAVSRLVYASMLCLMVALGLSVVTTWAGYSVEQPLAPQFDRALLAAVRSLASFVGAFGFAILFNSSFRTAAYVGLLAIVGNGIRLELHNSGLGLPQATFLGALAVGLSASLVRRWVDEARISLTVASVVMMVPGTYLFETLVLFSQGEILPALRTGVSASFVLGAMAMGLAVARFLSETKWLKDQPPAIG